MNNQEKEIYEAINAGERLYYALESAENYLSSASSWGLIDMFGGKSFSAFMKHSKISKAERELQEIKYLTLQFKNELGDISYMLDQVIDIDNALIFADYFIDGFLVDFLVQSRINDSKKKVKQLKFEVAQILNQLRRLV